MRFLGDGKKNNEKCSICDEDKNLLFCDTCVNSYHAYCLNPPLEELPEDEWSCPRCCLEEPNKKAEKILSWRWIEIKYPDPLSASDLPKEGEELTEDQKDAQMLKPSKKMPNRREREFFIKWKFLSYWHCTWVSELVMEVYFAQLLRSYWRKFDPNTPPEVDDGSTENLETGEIDGKEKEDDPHNLEEKFYRYGIKSEWMQVHRVLHHIQYQKGQFDYLVKWKELMYDQATWERDDQEIPGYEEQVFKYWLHRERMTGESVPKYVVKKMNAYAAEHNGAFKYDEDDMKKKRKKPQEKPTINVSL